MLSSRTATRAAASRPSARTAAPPPLSGPRRASATPVPRAHPLPSKSVIPRALDSERDRIAHDLLGAESYQALPNDLKAAVAETAGDEQVRALETVCAQATSGSKTQPKIIERNMDKAGGEGRMEG